MQLFYNATHMHFLIAEECTEEKFIQISVPLPLIGILMWLRCKFPIIHNIKLIALVLANPSTTILLILHDQKSSTLIFNPRNGVVCGLMMYCKR